MAWMFNGQGDHAALSPCASLLLGPAGTIAGWARRPDSSGVGADYLLSAGNYGAASSWYLNWNRASQYPYEKFRMTLRDAASHVVATYASAPLSEGPWHHVAVVWDPSVMRYYFNGALDPASVPMIGITLPFDPATPMSVGRLGAAYFTGSLAEFAKWNRVLSAAEVALLARGVTAERIPAGLAWYLPMGPTGELVARVPTRHYGTQTVPDPWPFHRRRSSWAREVAA